MGDNYQYFEPKTMFVPSVIKEETVELEDCDSFSSSGLMSAKCLETTPSISFPTMMFENPKPSEDRICEKNISETLTIPSSSETSIEGDNYIDICTKEKVSEGIKSSRCSNDYLTDLKNVVYKLEKISDQLAFAAVSDQYEQFGKYLVTLLRGIPQKKFWSLKQKFISDVIQAKMAVDESNSPATENCTVSQTVKPSEYGSYDRNTQYGDPYQVTSNKRVRMGVEGGSNDAVASSGGRSVSASMKVVSELPSVLTTSSVLLTGNETNGSNRTSSSTTNSYLQRPVNENKSMISKKHVKNQLKGHVEVQLEPIIMKESVLQAMEEDPLCTTNDPVPEAMEEYPLSIMKESVLQAMEEDPLCIKKESALQAMEEDPLCIIKESALQAMEEDPLCDVRKTKSLKRRRVLGRPSSLDKEERLNKQPHFLETHLKKKTKDCAVCSQRKIPGGRRETVYYCKTCSKHPGLHPTACFERYHTMLNYKTF